MQAYAADAAVADKKYKKKVVVVEGVLQLGAPNAIGLSATEAPRPAVEPAIAGAELAKIKPHFTLTAEEFFDEYKRDNKATTTKYRLIRLMRIVFHGCPGF